MCATDEGMHTSRWGRFVFTSPRAPAWCEAPGPEGPAPPGALGSAFRPEFEEYLRAQYARAVAQAKEFVDFVDPEPGAAVLEVGAGSGRITFDGGLAQRVGPTGQVLLTDPNVAQLHAALRRAAALGLSWVRALRAPAEELPLATGTADLVLGAFFLHFTDRQRALAEMARVVRPGGRVALSTALQHPWPAAWWEVLGPVREELLGRGLALHPYLPSAPELLGQLERSGLVVERQTTVGPEVMECPSADLAIVYARQMSLVRLLLRQVPAARHGPVGEAVEQRLRDVFARTPAAGRRLTFEILHVVARKPEAGRGEGA
jgi:SAM-dependent methyltransferase